MTVAKFTEVLDGFEFGAFGAMPTNQAFISLERGTVHFVSSVGADSKVSHCAA